MISNEDLQPWNNNNTIHTLLIGILQNLVQIDYDTENDDDIGENIDDYDNENEQKPDKYNGVRNDIHER